MEKKQILQQALTQLNTLLKSETGSESSPDLFAVTTRLSGNSNLVTISSDPLALEYTVFIQAWAPQKDINALITQLKSVPGKGLLFADFINPVMAEKFHQSSVSFVDCAGNAYI
ncbi:MAG: hypothetical protein RQ982_02480, partial [Gammaproteobacteria bacterium]|nr:hypothetical protein [Gammaproteobacteria bacterium]